MCGFLERIRQEVRSAVPYPCPPGEGEGDGGGVAGDRGEEDYHVSSYPPQHPEVTYSVSGCHRSPKEQEGGPCQ